MMQMHPSVNILPSVNMHQNFNFNYPMTKQLQPLDIQLNSINPTINQINIPPFSKNIGQNPRRMQPQYEPPMMYNNYNNRMESNQMNYIPMEEPNPQYWGEYEMNNNFNNDFIINKVNLNSRMESYNNKMMIRNQNNVQNQPTYNKPNTSNFYYYY